MNYGVMRREKKNEKESRKGRKGDTGEMVSLFIILQNSLTQKQLGDGINHFAHGGVPLIICVWKKRKKNLRNGDSQK